jgi:molybdopterin synthase catalytic subunit
MGRLRTDRMRQQFIITREPIDEKALSAERPVTGATGAVVVFHGVVRQSESDRPIAGLEYEAFERMAEHQVRLICERLEQQWELASIRLVHRIGFVRAGETSLWIEVTARHRQEALAACAFLIDEIKRFVPIWKHPVELPIGAGAPK